LSKQVKRKQFKVNDHITLKLKKKKTIVYIDGEEFQQCKYLLLTFPVRKIDLLDEVKSIDDAAEMLDKSLERRQEGNGVLQRKSKIPPEMEFWAHCSNLQAWAENDYDTRLLHSNLAFPLLKALTRVGDGKAKKIFKEEIVERYNSGCKNVREFLRRRKYLDYLSRNEFLCLLDDPVEIEVISNLEKSLKDAKNRAGRKKKVGIEIKNGKVSNLYLGGFNLLKISPLLKKLKYLKDLDLRSNPIKELPDWIGKFQSLKYLNLSNNQLIRLNPSIGKLTQLEKLDLYGNKLKKLPQSIGNLRSLKVLELHNNELESLPESLGNLSFLTKLLVNDNKLKTLPESIGNLNSLIELSAHHNQLETLPESIGNLKSLYRLLLRSNNLKSLPETLGDLENLVNLSLNYNKLTSLPKFTGKFARLGILQLENNPLSEVPDAIFEHPKVSTIQLRGTNITLTKKQEEIVKRKKIDLWL